MTLTQIIKRIYKSSKQTVDALGFIMEAKKSGDYY